MATRRRAVLKTVKARLFKGVYRPIPQWSPAEVEAALERGSLDALRLMALSASLYGTDWEWAERVCLQLARHADPIVRGNAILSFGHLARRFGHLTRSVVQPLIEAGLRDDDEHVRGPADDAADDVNHFLGWTIHKPYGSA